jgi:hypothetical protein
MAINVSNLYGIVFDALKICAAQECMAGLASRGQNVCWHPKESVKIVWIH